MQVRKEKNAGTWKNIWIAVLAVACLGTSCFAVYEHFSRTKLSSDEQKLIAGYHLLQNEWLYGNEESYLRDDAIAGLLNGPASTRNDPYTFYTKNRDEQGLSTDGKGFGFTSHSYDGGLYILGTEMNSPSEKAGLTKGDVLYSITSPVTYSFKEHTFTEIDSYLKGLDSSTAYTFTGVHPNQKEFTLKRTKSLYSSRLIDVVDIPKSSNGNTRTIKINTRLGSPTTALHAVLETYKNQIEHLVLDFRGNGGGYLDQASARASLFVKKGTLLYERKNKDGKTISSVYQTKEPAYQFKKYTIIQDGETASASETFILARRAGTNAKVYGFKSYGKGIAQNFLRYSDGSVIRYTSAYVYGPERENETRYDEGKDKDNIRCIQKKGILPDVRYSYDYQYLSANWTLSETTGISEYGQNLFLSALRLMDSSVPENYSKTYHFDDAIESYFNLVKEKYGLRDAFNEKGAMDRTLNQKWDKDCFDLYLEHYDQLTRRCYD